VENRSSGSPVAEVLASFVSHFSRAIRQEMDCMRERMGSFQIGLTAGERSEPDETQDGARYTYRIASNDEKLVAGAECTLRTEKSECLVRIERLEGGSVTLSCSRHVELGTGEAALVIYPWFLYEKLLQVLGDIGRGGFFVERALTLFGKSKAASRRRDLLRPHGGLNASQLAAVQLCSDSDLAFVWGPPGTGKTTTLAHIVHELLAHGMRVLILSSTNAALDQVLEKVAANSEMGEAINAGRVVRIGRSEGPTCGAALRDVLTRLNAANQKELDRILRRRPAVDLALRYCEKALETLSQAEAPFQKNLFGNHEQSRSVPNLAEIFSQRRTTQLLGLGPAELIGLVRRRHARLLRVRELCAKGIEDRRNALARKERQVVDGATLVLSTLTNAYFSPLMQEQRFDVVVVEEASMAILPALFYAACLGRRKTIMVGDPCQLPSIVHSDESYVRKVMGRNIFEVAIADPLSSPLVAMLDVQYRMHPVIGDIVSHLFYSGRLKHGSETAMCERIAALEPYAGAPLIVLDTIGRTTCHQAAAGQSRINVETGTICVDLALQAVASGAESVAIVTPYADQARAIRSLLKEQPGAVPSIECSTVHRFQGQERDVVILDTVDADPMKPGVLLTERGPGSTARNLINVAISRARGKLVIVADVKYFESRVPGSVISKMIERALAAGRREFLRA